MNENKTQIKKTEEEDDKMLYGDLAMIFIVFSLLCLATSLFFNSSKELYYKSIITPSVIGPFTSKKENSVYEIAVDVNIKDNSWAFVSGEVLDSSQNYLFAFGQELWRESGRDSDGNWSEQDSSYDLNVTLKESGQYYLKFISESGQARYGETPDDKTRAVVKISEKNGSSLPHLWVGVISLILAIFFNEKRASSIRKIIQNTGAL